MEARVKSLAQVAACVRLATIFVIAVPCLAPAAGYVNMNYPAGYSLIANPLDSVPNNTLAALFQSDLPENSQIFKLNGGGYLSYTYRMAGGWFDSNNNPANNVTLVPGQGAALYLPSVPPTITFLGDVVGFDFNNNTRLPVTPPPPGVYLLASLPPLAGSTFQDIIGRAPNDLDAVQFLNTAGSQLTYIFESGNWHDPFGGSQAPTVGVGLSAFFDLTGNQFVGFAPPIATVPEPLSIALVGFGVPVLLAFRRRGLLK